MHFSRRSIYLSVAKNGTWTKYATSNLFGRLFQSIIFVQFARFKNQLNCWFSKDMKPPLYGAIGKPALHHLHLLCVFSCCGQKHKIMDKRNEKKNAQVFFPPNQAKRRFFPIRSMCLVFLSFWSCFTWCALRDIYLWI